jgi:anti-sigma B factor antagonist
MSDFQRLEVSQIKDVTVVRLVDRKILDELIIQELDNELSALVEKEGRNQLLLNFCHIEFLSSAALGKLLSLERKVKKLNGRLKLSNIRPEIYEVFQLTRLNQVFEIYDTELEALESF